MSEPRELLPPADSSAPPRLALKAKEAAEALGIGVQLLWEQTNVGAIPHVRIGRRVLYPVDRLRAWLAEQSEGGQP